MGRNHEWKKEKTKVVRFLIEFFFPEQQEQKESGKESKMFVMVKIERLKLETAGTKCKDSRTPNEGVEVISNQA